MFLQKRWALIALLVALGAVALAACTPTTETVTVEVTRVVTETVVEEGETVEVTRIVTETVVEEVQVEPEEEPAGPKDLIICMAQEPDSLYPYGTSMLAAQAVQHAIFENNTTTLSYAYQARGLEKVPSLNDGDAVVNEVEVNAGDTVVDAAGNVAVVEEGTVLLNSAGEEVTFDGTAVMMEQIVVDFTMKPRVWSDGTPVTANDSVYSFNVLGDPDTPASKFTVERTASYEATGDLTTRWTGVPGFKDSTFFINFWQPFPEHVWGGLSAAEMLEAEPTSRLPVGDGPFAIAGFVVIISDSIRPRFDRILRSRRGKVHGPPA
jgi:peptide/nickel transport system substrate-binding protein